MSQWINVKERCPPSIDITSEWGSENVLITDGKSISFGYFEPEYFGEDHGDENCIYSSEMWHDLPSLLCGNEVTHWMELPKPANV